MDQNGSSWIKMDLVGSKWIKLDKIGSHWHGRDKHGQTWSCQIMFLTNIVLKNVVWQTWIWQTWSWQTWSWQTRSWQTWALQTWALQTWSLHALNSILKQFTHGLRFDSQSCFSSLNLIFLPAVAWKILFWNRQQFQSFILFRHFKREVPSESWSKL